MYLDPGAGVQHDVLDGPLDVLRPGHQPRDLVVMANLLPLGPGGRLGVLGVPMGKNLYKSLYACYIYSYKIVIIISAISSLRNHKHCCKER